MIYLPLYVTYIISMAEFKVVRDWSLIMGRGCLQNGRGGGASEVLPLQKKGGGAEQVLAMLKGVTTCFEVVLT